MRGASKWLIGLYPRAWRERYEEEFLAVLEDRKATFSDFADIALGALDAWIRPQTMFEGRIVFMMRSSVLWVLWAWVGLVIAGAGFQKMTEYEDFVRAARDHALIGAAFDTVVIGAVVALAAVAVGGAPIAFAALRNALVSGRRDVPLQFCAPLLCLAAFVGYVLLLMKAIYPALGRLTVHDPVNVALFVSLVGAFVLAAVGSTASISAAIRRSEVGEELFRFAMIPAVVAFGAMAAVLAGTFVWGLALAAKDPALFGGDDGILATGTAVTWVVIVTVMALSVLISCFAVIRGWRARHPASPAL